MNHSDRGLLTSNLRPTTLRKIAWFLKVPQNELDVYFRDLLPHREEGEIILTFSKYTRALAGDDPELPPDDAAEEKRFKATTVSWAKDSGATGSSTGGGTGAASGAAASSSTATASTEKVAEAPVASAPSRKAAASEKSSGASMTGPASKKRKTNQAATAASAPATTQYSIVEEGRRVAAKLEDEWIMMTVIKFNKRTKVYTLEDADDQADKTDSLEVPRDFVIPLASPEYSPPMFPVGSRVLAVFPGTTSFYPAVVAKVTKRPLSTAKQQTMKPIYDYVLQFDDDDEEGGEAVPRKVKGDVVIEDPAA